MFSSERRIINIVVTAAIIGVLGILIISLFRGGGEEIAEEVIVFEPEERIIGRSVEGREIKAYIYGGGENHLLFVGGIHGGYEWNSTLLAYQFMDYLEDEPESIPENIKVSVIPFLNPDGLFDVVGKEGRFNVSDVAATSSEESVEDGVGRFNANGVDLNRNFDCKWQEESTWKDNLVSAGEEVFSEPESRAIRDFVMNDKPSAVVFWHSQANAVYASECEDGVLPETKEIMNAYSGASGYRAVESFDAYEITGDAEGWLASINIPAITVELSTHESVEFEKNLDGVKALFNYFSN